MSEERWTIPASWDWATAGDIARIVGGGTPSSKVEGNFAEEGIPWITPADLTGYRESHISRGRRDLSEQGFAGSGAQLIPAGSVLFSSRAPIGYCVIASNEVSTNQGFKSLVLDGEIDPGYIRHYLLSAKEYAESKASGTTFMELSGARVAELAVPIAPLPEQRRIVAKVDGLTARTARARKELDRIPTLIARYKQRLLALAADGLLTRGWRDENGGEAWQATTVEKLAETTFDGPFGSNLKSADYVDSGVRVVRLENIGSLRFIREKKTYISEAKFKSLQRHELKPDDVLFSSFIAEEIRVCLLPVDLDTIAINKADCFCVRVNRNICLPKFLAYRLASPTCYEVLKEAVHGATRPGSRLAISNNLKSNCRRSKSKPKSSAASIPPSAGSTAWPPITPPPPASFPTSTLPSSQRRSRVALSPKTRTTKPPAYCWNGPRRSESPSRR
ncbi:restriction endonuclease subunit S [Sphingomonas aurantiaca]|uniref:restriction endonuclease subunit S n=1 Tax=Sphingomonas aurantiaca TaxID=185949 RepID=UPI002FDF347A